MYRLSSSVHIVNTLLAPPEPTPIDDLRDPHAMNTNIHADFKAHSSKTAIPCALQRCQALKDNSWGINARRIQRMDRQDFCLRWAVFKCGPLRNSRRIWRLIRIYSDSTK